MPKIGLMLVPSLVALRKESVDRNTTLPFFYAFLKVALRKESVDRNYWEVIKMLLRDVALRKESVDRNNDTSYKKKSTRQSLSARRAWIEMCPRSYSQC